MAGKQLPYFRMFIGFVFGMTMVYTVQYIGALRLGEILAIPYLFLFVPRFFAYFKKDKLLQYSLAALTCWILIQLASDWYNQTARTDVLKGIANLVVAASSFIFLIVLVRKDVSVLMMILIGRSIGSVFFADYIQTSDEILSNEYWDLRIAGFAGPLVLAIGLLLVNRMRLLVVLGFLVYGAAAIAFGGRSHGLIYCLAGVSVLLLPHVKRRIATVSKRKLTREIIATTVAVSVVFPLFVYIGLQGHITDKTQQQLQGIENPYNPVQVILSARGGLQYGLNAIKRRPLAGYGSRAYEGDYVPLGGMVRREYNYIHSMIMESGAFGGIGAFFCCLYLWYLILKQCVRLGSFSNAQCNLIASYCAFSLSWNFLCNPLSSFRLVWPFVMIMIWCVDVEQKPKERIVQGSPGQRKHVYRV